MTLFQIISAKYLQICLLPLRGGRVGLLFSVCKGKQLYSESNRFLGYWSNKFCKYLCNYLFYREISINRESLPLQPPPTPPKGGEASLQVFCRNYLRKESLSSRVYIGTPPPSGRLGGACTPLLSEGSGEAVEVG